MSGLLSLLIGSRVGRWIGKVLAGAVFALGLLWKLKRDARKEVELENAVDRLEGAVEADRRMDHADIGADASDDDNREWLRERGARRGEPRP